GVSKSGSPTPKPITSCPSAFICLAFESMASVSEGVSEAARCEILYCINRSTLSSIATQHGHSPYCYGGRARQLAAGQGSASGIPEATASRERGSFSPRASVNLASPVIFQLRRLRDERGRTDVFSYSSLTFFMAP